MNCVNMASIYWKMVEIIKEKIDNGTHFVRFDEIEIRLNDEKKDGYLVKLTRLHAEKFFSVNWSLDGLIVDDRSINIDKLNNMKSIFIVHGHNVGIRAELEASLYKIGLVPIVLMNEPSRGKTIIEKIEEYGDVSHAIIILTPDDQGKALSDADLSFRARQNVILELGYFMGRLGRRNTIALCKGKIEIPSDFHGVIYIEADKPNVDWKYEVYKELKASGLPVKI